MKRTDILFIVILAFAIISPSATLAQSDPQKKAEEEVRETINRWGELWNENNQGALLEMYHPEAKIMYGWGNQKGRASKKEYEGILLERIAANPSIGVEISKVKTKGERATAVVNMKTKGGVSRVTFDMIKENERWLITAFKY